MVPLGSVNFDKQVLEEEGSSGVLVDNNGISEGCYKSEDELEEGELREEDVRKWSDHVC